MYKAKFRETGQIVAVKVIEVAMVPGQHGEDINNVKKEIEFLKDCDHSSVTCFLGAFYKCGALWIVMEYCGGGSIGDLARKYDLTEEQIAVVMKETLEGIS